MAEVALPCLRVAIPDRESIRRQLPLDHVCWALAMGKWVLHADLPAFDRNSHSDAITDSSVIAQCSGSS
jgi:hypothetical protein